MGESVLLKDAKIINKSIQEAIVIKFSDLDDTELFTESESEYYVLLTFTKPVTCVRVINDLPIVTEIVTDLFVLRSTCKEVGKKSVRIKLEKLDRV